MNNKILGRYGEDLAVDFLKAEGYRILDKNFKNKCGEIDLIAHDGAMVVFIEVKSRKSLSYGMPYESVHPLKQRKITQVALSYLKYRYGSVDVLSRFDVISIYQTDKGDRRIEHLTHAFDAAY